MAGAIVVGALMIAKGIMLVLWLLPFANWSERRRLGVVLVAATFYVVLAGVVVPGNVRGRTLEF
jgi:hypothetical protein